ILNEFMGGMFGKVPAYTSIGYWTQELGLSVYKESCSLFKDKRYALIIDESMMIGSEKLLLTLAVSADNEGHVITEKDIVIVDISIAKSWNGTTIKDVLKKVAEKIGHDPEYVISDNGSTIGKAVRDAGYRHHLDISHSLGMFLERVYKNEPDFQELSKKVSDARLKYNMQEVAFIQPPSQRSIARFINMSKWIEWASRMQYVYLDRETSFMNEDESHNASTDTIESTFGVAKARKSDDKLAGVTPIILMMPLRLHFADKTRRVNFNFKERLETGRHRHIKEWTDVNLSPNLVIKRRETIGKKCVGF
ncbi:MAG: transposase family protein, partial [Prevotella sp.]|nr:transposase family protein [Prevotella sp.]